MPLVAWQSEYIIQVTNLVVTDQHTTNKKQVQLVVVSLTGNQEKIVKQHSLNWITAGDKWNGTDDN